MAVDLNLEKNQPENANLDGAPRALWMQFSLLKNQPPTNPTAHIFGFFVGLIMTQDLVRNMFRSYDIYYRTET